VSIQETGRPNYMKYINKKKVLKCIMNNNNSTTLSRADISKMLHISKPTISNLVEELLVEGWIYEVESENASSLGGRKPFHLLFNQEAQYIIGIDIGGTLVEMAIMDLEGEFIIHSSIMTQDYLDQGLIKVISNLIREMIIEADIDTEKIMAIGVGAPGITDVKKGVVTEAPSLGWNHYPLKEEVEKYLDYPVYIENDVNVAVLGEQWKGVAKEKDNVILMTLGTGVGCGIIVNGQLYHGSNYAAGEIGYLVTDKSTAKQEYDSAFAGYGFLDNHVGGPSIVLGMLKQLKEASKTEKYRTQEEEWTAEEIFELAKSGDPVALRVINEVIEHIGFAIINIICIFNPQCVVLGGGISKSGDWFLPKVRELVEKHLPEQSQMEIYITQLPQVSLLGTASLCLKNHESLLKS
jgi:glucokinase